MNSKMVSTNTMLLPMVLLLQIFSTTYAIQKENLTHSAEPERKPKELPIEIKEQTLHIDLNNIKNNMTAVFTANSKPATNTTVIKQVTIDSDAAVLPVAPNGVKDAIVDSGAMLRGFYVFLGLSLLTIFYFLVKTYRLRNGSQAPTQVRKYGVLTRRGDVEMLPLPLDDDDEDDTVFDLGNHSTDQHNNRGIFAQS